MRNKAVIDLRTLENNAKKIKERLPDGVKFCAVVKADAYGHGACACASALYKVADCFAVALVEEGEVLRLSGIDKEILVLIPVLKEDAERAITFGLSLTVASVKDVLLLEETGKRQNKTVSVHIAFNSGMNRLGADENELLSVIERLKKCKYVKATGIFSHFACPENDKRRKAAMTRFLKACEEIKTLNPLIVRHISASGGFIKGEYLDMVRIGILLYGYKPFPTDINVKPAMRVYSRTVAKRKVKKGGLALYGDKPLKRETAYSVIRAGYADGFFRKRSENLVNNRCMDTSGVMGNFNGVIMGDAEKIAQENGTISYEILCAATVRAEKKYIR